MLVLILNDSDSKEVQAIRSHAIVREYVTRLKDGIVRDLSAAIPILEYS